LYTNTATHGRKQFLKFLILTLKERHKQSMKILCILFFSSVRFLVLSCCIFYFRNFGSLRNILHRHKHRFLPSWTRERWNDAFTKLLMLICIMNLAKISAS
jgi:hypothetical protein